MPHFVIHHHHEPTECPVAYAAWRGFQSPLRHGVTVASCAFGGHELWWTVDAASEPDALALLPRYVAQRARAIQVGQVEVP
jgi:hypothetical protein